MTQDANKDWKHDETIRAELERYIAEQDLTHREIAERLHFSGTRVTKYLNLSEPGRAPEPDMIRVEAAARNFLRHARRVAALRENLFENEITDSVFSVLKLIRRSGDVGLIHSPGGVGKTSAITLYARDNPNTLLVIARQYASGSHAIGRLLLGEYIQTTGARWPGNINPSLWLEDCLRGSEALLIVDNAQRLHISAFKWLMDFHDATGSAIAFIGNTEVLRTLRSNDPEGQLVTRIGIVRKVQMKKPASQKKTAAQLIAQFAPGGETLQEAAEDALKTCGNARTLKKQLILARELREIGEDRDWHKCFEIADAQLVHPVTRFVRPE